MKYHVRAVCKLALCCVWLWSGLVMAAQEPAPDGVPQTGDGGSTSLTGMQKPCFEERGGETSEQREVDALADLGDYYRAWLTEDVVYIIRPVERCEFLHLESSDERDQYFGFGGTATRSRWTTTLSTSITGAFCSRTRNSVQRLQAGIRTVDILTFCLARRMRSSQTQAENQQEDRRRRDPRLVNFRARDGVIGISKALG